MPAFFSPIESPETWDLSLATNDLTIPAGLRYAGYTFRGLVARSRLSAANVFVPALGVLRKATDGEKTFVEIQVNPFPIRQIIAALPWGVPTFYLVFDASSGPFSFDDGQTAPGNESLRMVTAVTLLCAGQDRSRLDPALWAQQIKDAITDGGGSTMTWEPFASVVSSRINSGPSAPVLLLDHAGQPRTSGEIDIVYGDPGSETVYSVTLVESDGGDLQTTVARINSAGGAAPPNLWGSASSLRLRRAVSDTDSDLQFVRLEDRVTGGNEIGVTPSQRHISFTDLHDWFAPQFVVPADPLQHFTRDNRVKSLVNGPAYFDDLFRELLFARMPDRGLHLTGWSMFPDAELTKLRDGTPDDRVMTLARAAELIGAGGEGGGCRFLPARFYHIEDAETLEATEALAFYLVMSGILVLNSFGVSFARTDGSGTVVLLALWIGSIVYVNYILDEGGRAKEPNLDAVETLGEITNSRSPFSPYPATVDDNPLASTDEFPFTTIFRFVRHFGIYHQKFGVVRNETGYIGYCGGIDLNPDRLDTADHLAAGPYHDVQARVEGPAVRDLALSFAERWTRDGGGEDLAFSTPKLADLGTPGTDIVQVARTYFQPADPSRALEFAPNGDRTIADTMIKAIQAAREFIYIEDQYFTPPEVYIAALKQKLQGPEKIRKLIIALPSITDQPFGGIARSELIDELRAYDNIVHIGYPRRHYTVPDNDTRVSSGKCILGADLPALDTDIVLGPKARVPAPPFWIAVEGELMWAYDEATDPPPNDQSRRLKVVRGDDTRLVKGLPTPKGAKARSHKKGAAATIVELSGIYVHSKMMIVDDVFLGIGSANLNQRGLFHDGEINIFTTPQELKASPTNPIAVLRRQLWAEMLNLPAEMAAGLLQDPLAAAKLFDRSPFGGNRYVDINAYPAHLMFEAITADQIVVTVLGLLGFAIGADEHTKFFDSVVDPTSALESA